MGKGFGTSVISWSQVELDGQPAAPRRASAWAQPGAGSAPDQGDHARLLHLLPDPEAGPGANGPHVLSRSEAAVLAHG